jgi:hypothetical protein
VLMLSADVALMFVKTGYHCVHAMR